MFVKEVGMPPMEAIVANTSRNAWLMGLEGEVGVIATGKLADIVICNSDPVADIIVLQRPSQISTIIKGGRIIDSGRGGSASCLLSHLVPVRQYRVRLA